MAVRLTASGACALVSALVVCSAAAPSPADLDAALRTQIAADHVPGLAFAVVRSGRIVRTGAYGFANLEWKAPVSIHTRFEIASLSKMFVGAAVRILIEDGKLNPDTPVGAYFHGVPDAWRDMKIRHLITMSSGLPEDFASELIPYDQDVTTPYDDGSMVRAFFTLKMAAPVGARFVYSSPNYAMLGMTVANLAKQPYAQFVRERIFSPAGMTESSIIDNEVVVPERAEGYRRASSGEIRKGRYLGQYLHARPDDGVLTSAGDLARWLIALQDRRIVRDPEKLWDATSSDTGRPLDYAYGWFQDTWLGHRRQQHSGGLRTGFHTFIARYPDDDLGVVVLTNCDFSPIRDYVDLIARQYIAGVSDPGAEMKSPDANPAETQQAIHALQTLIGGSIDAALMDPDAVEPIGLDEIAGFLKGAADVRYAGRGTLQGDGLTMHGHRLVSYVTLAMQLEGRTQFVTLYRDASRKFAYLEATN